MPVSSTGFKRRRFSDIFASMDVKAREEFGADINTGEKTPLGIMLRLMAWSLGEAWQEIEDVYHSTDITSAEGNRLLRLAASKGITPYEEEYATGQIRIVGTPGYTLPAGFLVKTGEGVVFATVDSLTLNINGSGTVAIKAMTAGYTGNVAAESITIVVNPSAHVSAVSNPEATDGGRDSESLFDFRNRYFEEVQSPPANGNRAHYIKLVRQIPGIADARVFRAVDGGGTAKVVLLSEDRRTPNAVAVATAAELINNDEYDNRPINAAVTVVGVTEVLISVSAMLTLRSGGTMVAAEEQIRETIGAYLQKLAFTDLVVRYNKIGEAILDAADVLDYSNLQVNGGTANLELAEDQVPVMGAVTIT